jgi:hypothetical protein
VKEVSKIRKIAFVGDHQPHKCGIATFTSDLIAAVASVHPQSQCLAVSVNHIPGGYEARAPISTTSILKHKQPSPPAWRPIALRQTFGGTNKRNVPLTGSSAGTIWESNFTLPRRAAVAMACTSTGSTGTRELNPLWRSSFLWRRCDWRKMS